MSDADRVQVALSTAEARVEELEGEVVRLKKELFDIIAMLRRADENSPYNEIAAILDGIDGGGHVVKEPADAR